MNIKKLIVGSMLSMLLVSEMAAADWGDVYYCHMTNNNGITLEGEMTKYKLEKFIFKLDQTKNAMVFESTGYFKNEVYELTTGRTPTGRTLPRLEYWNANDESSVTYFEEGKFLFTQNAIQGQCFDCSKARIISADCEKF